MTERENVGITDVVKYKHTKASKIRGTTIGVITSSLILSGVASHDARALQVPPPPEEFSHTLRLPQIASDGPPVRLIEGVEVLVSPPHKIIIPDVTKREDIPSNPPPSEPNPPVSAQSSSGKSGDTEGVWDLLAACESTSNWAANTGNGYYGGLQEGLSFWANYGGLEFAPSPHLATRDEQIIVAKRGLASEGWGAWPACASKLGLR